MYTPRAGPQRPRGRRNKRLAGGGQKKRRLAGKTERSYMIHLRLLCVRARDSIRLRPRPPSASSVSRCIDAWRAHRASHRSAIGASMHKRIKNIGKTHTHTRARTKRQYIYTRSFSLSIACARRHYFRFQMRKCAFGCAFLLIFLCYFWLFRSVGKHWAPDFHNVCLSCCSAGLHFFHSLLAMFFFRSFPNKLSTALDCF